MKRLKPVKIDWATIPWTPFKPATVPDHPLYTAGDNEPPQQVWLNSRYQVAVWFDGTPEFPVWGEWAHLSIKTHDRQAYHDWRDLQRIKNEIIGPEYDAVEVYPAESKLVDTANQYHLFVFNTLKLPFGYQTRLVADLTGGTKLHAEQRAWAPGERPADCLTAPEIESMIDDLSK